MCKKEECKKNCVKNVWKDVERERRGREGGKGIYVRFVLYICIIVIECFKRCYLIYMYMYVFFYIKLVRFWNGCFIG